MLVFQLLASIFILAVLNRILSKYKEKRIPKSEVIVWFVFWFIAAGAIWWPKTTDKLAQLVGVTRGVDLIVTASVAVIFYLLFKVFSHLHQIDRQLTKLVRNLSLQEHHKQHKHGEKEG